MDLGLSVMGKKPVLVLFTCFHCILSHSVLMRVWHLLRFIPLCSFLQVAAEHGVTARECQLKTVVDVHLASVVTAPTIR